MNAQRGKCVPCFDLLLLENAGFEGLDQRAQANGHWQANEAANIKAEYGFKLCLGIWSAMSTQFDAIRSANQLSRSVCDALSSTTAVYRISGPRYPSRVWRLDSAA